MDSRAEAETGTNADVVRPSNSNIVEWPFLGSVEFENIHLRYREELPMVLNGISLKIPYG